jgi:hypothetical protein
MPSKKKTSRREIRDYDEHDTTTMIDRERPLKVSASSCLARPRRK